MLDRSNPPLVQAAIRAMRPATTRVSQTSGILAPLKTDAANDLAGSVAAITLGSDPDLLARGAGNLMPAFAR